MPYDYSQQKEPMRTREYAYVKEVENMLNGSFDFGRFAACLPEMHRTLQQRFFRLVKECILVMAGPGNVAGAYGAFRAGRRRNARNRNCR